MPKVIAHLPFSKFEGLGNDFVIVDGSHPDVSTLTPEQAIAICDRHRGVGADGVLVVGLNSGQPYMRVINADGSRPEMCGNGIRCVALYLRNKDLISRARFTVSTDAGPHECIVSSENGATTVEVAMRPPTFEPSEVPVRSTAPLIDRPLSFDDDTLRITALSVGNPHAVTFDSVGERKNFWGPRVGMDERFPEGVNVGFARLRPSKEMDLEVFERGAGWTQACGTGAVAAAAAAVETGRLPRHTPIRVHLPGGTMTIVISDPGSPVHMTGPARHVFDGVLGDSIRS